MTYAEFIEMKRLAVLQHETKTPGALSYSERGNVRRVITQSPVMRRVADVGMLCIYATTRRYNGDVCICYGSDGG